MSIYSEITRLYEVRGDVLQAIEDKGVTVPIGSKLADCPGLIAAISGGGEFDINNIVPIVPVSKIYVVDNNGYIGYDITKYFRYDNQTIYYNFAILATGNDFSQMGLGQVTLTPASTDYIGGREYRTVTIGGVTWMAENLDFRDSNISIGLPGSPDTPAAWYYNNDEDTYGEDGNKYGLLYNWHSVKYLNDNRNLLINGWHVPSVAEWNSLASTIGGTGIAGDKLKSSTGWSSGNGDGTYGFGAFPAGNRSSGTFHDLGYDTYFWTSDEYSSIEAYYKYFNTGAAMNANNGNKKYLAFSVRLVKDVP